MAFDVDLVSFDSPNSGGTPQTTTPISSLSFTSKAILSLTSTLAADGGTGGARFAMGISDGIGSAHNFSVASGTTNGSATSIASRSQRNTRSIIHLNQNIPGCTLEASTNAFNSNGFDINWAVPESTSDIPGTIRKILSLCLGGSDITNIKAGEFLIPTTTAESGYISVGFKYDLLILISAGFSTAPPSGTGNARLSFGLSTGVGNGVASGYGSIDNAAPTAARYQRTDKPLIHVSGDASKRWEGTITTNDSTGFKVTMSTAAPDTDYCFYIAIQGGQHKVGSFLASTGGGSQDVTGIGFIPKGVLLMSVNDIARTTPQNNCKFGMGMGISSSKRGCSALADKTAATSNCSTYLDRANLLRLITENGGSPTTDSACDLSSFASDKFTISWGVTPAVQTEILYWAFGDNAPAPPVPNPPQRLFITREVPHRKRYV